MIALFLAVTIGGIALVKFSTRPTTVQMLSYQLIDSYPHDTESFTQGLIHTEGKLYESTGLDGDNPNSKSQVRIHDLKTGTVEKEITLEGKLFGEGLTRMDDKLYQLTWKDNKVFVYDLELNLLETIEYNGEGWGLTTDGKYLILSDGSSFLTYLEPVHADGKTTLKIVSKLDIRDANRFRLHDINELEYIDGFIYANIWHRDEIVCISPKSQRVVAKLDLSGLYKHAYEESLNGIAFDKTSGNWLVTGKLWPKIYEIKVGPQ